MKDTYRVMPVLKEHPLFSIVDEVFLEQFIQHKDCKFVFYQGGDTICSEEAFHKAIGVIIKGTANVYRLGHGSPVLLNTLTAGKTFGAASLFSEEERSVTRITAKGRCYVFYMPDYLFELLLRDNRDLSMAYIRFLSGKIRFLNKRIAELSAPAVEQKLAKYLSECGERLTPNMAELASTLGIGRASLYRCLDAFIRRGLIRKNDHDIVILDPDGIKELI